MNKHTPGPWRTVKLAGQVDSRINGYGIAYGRSGNRLAIVDGEGNSNLANDANARLISAAPELLEALQDVLCTLTMDAEWTKDCYEVRKAEAAIAKATGAA